MGELQDSILETIGLSSEQLREEVVDRLAGKLMGADFTDDVETRIERKLDKLLDAAVTKVADEKVLPRVVEIVEGVTLQATNKWGEKRGEPLTFTEYLVQRAEAYMQERVDWNGQSKDESGSLWTGQQTRITYLIHQHLHHHIRQAMKEALKDLNMHLVKGLQATVEIKLNEITADLKKKLSS